MLANVMERVSAGWRRRRRRRRRRSWAVVLNQEKK
jgi:hypothetical protein